MITREIIEEYLKFREGLNSKDNFYLDFHSLLHNLAQQIDFLDFPVDVGVNITNRCNLNCVHCFKKKYGDQMNKDELTIDEWKKFIDTLADHGIVRIYITGGEPFLRKDLMELIQYIKEYEFISLSIFTNGTFITPKIVKQLARILSEDDLIQVSLDVHLKTLNDIMRGIGSYDGALRAIALLGNENIDIRVNSVVTKYNVDFMADYYNFLKEYPVKYLSFSPLFPLQNIRDLVPPIGRVLVNFYKVLKVYDKSSWPVISEDPIPTYPLVFSEIRSLIKDRAKDISYLCPAARSSIEIDPSGDVYPCPFLQVPKYRGGNIKTEYIFKIWHRGKNWEALRYREIYYDNKCSSCNYFKYCKGGCPASAEEFYGNIKYPDGRCDIWKD